MSRLMRAELLKMICLRSLWLAALAGVAITVIGTYLAIHDAGKAANPPLGSEPLALILTGPSGILWLLSVMLGIMMSAGEWTHRTVRVTFLVTPQRRRVVTAKLAAGMIIGATSALLIAAAALTTAVPMLAARGLPVPIGSADTWQALGAVVGVSALWSMFGVAIGSLLRNQTAALGSVLIWLLVVEGVLPLVLHQPEAARWLPGSAARAVLSIAQPTEGLLVAWGGGLLFIGYVAAFSLVGALATARTDVR